MWRRLLEGVNTRCGFCGVVGRRWRRVGAGMPILAEGKGEDDQDVNLATPPPVQNNMNLIYTCNLA